VTDGWYIDLDTLTSCEPSWRSARSGHAFLTVHQQGEEGDVPTFKDVGEPERGFAVASKATSSGTITLPDGSTRQHVSTWETEVTELSDRCDRPRALRDSVRIQTGRTDSSGTGSTTLYSLEASLRPARAPPFTGLNGVR